MGVSVRHNSRLAALVAIVAAVMTVAWFSRALQTGSLADWAWCALVAAVGVLQLLVLRDGRAPLMVADEHGVRVRHGETWSGLRWQDIENVEVQSPASWLRDGQIVVHPARVEPVESSEDSEETPAVAQAYVVPLSRTTRVEYDGLTGHLVEDLDALASGRVPVLVLTRVEQEPAEVESVEETETEETEDTRPVGETVVVELPEEQVEEGVEEAEKPSRGRWARLFGLVTPTPTDDDAADTDAEKAPESTPTPLVPAQPRAGAGDSPAEKAEPEFEPVEPGREPQVAARSESVRDSVRMLPNPPTVPAQRSSDVPVLVARVDDFTPTEPRPAAEAVIGPQIAAARHRARLSIDTLSERTRIRPHVLESIEVDDFEVCGGDFYARGHLRTLARIFGLDAQQLLDLYDEKYAKAEIEARQVFEAELATGIGGGVRAAHTGPRWTLLAACVLALASVWGVARIFNDTPQELVSPAPNVVDSAGLAKADPTKAPRSTLAPLGVTAVGASPQVVVRDRSGRILWAGKLNAGQHQQVIGLAPFDVTASNGKAVKVSFLDKAKGTVGPTAAAGSKQFG